ncbi:hypothetical protein SAY87_002959 [Trapa incisa]|uniref:Uncharacterized protein n=1 Tax=Trapa incisa TaxID=236973 RepID=A0AAN7KEX3_9MYRT|nr:hypothetical protein SAY87_002959 [Trapa incisa]
MTVLPSLVEILKDGRPGRFIPACFLSNCSSSWQILQVRWVNTFVCLSCVRYVIISSQRFPELSLDRIWSELLTHHGKASGFVGFSLFTLVDSRDFASASRSRGWRVSEAKAHVAAFA